MKWKGKILRSYREHVRLHEGLLCAYLLDPENIFFFKFYKMIHYTNLSILNYIPSLLLHLPKSYTMEFYFSLIGLWLQVLQP